MRRVFRDLQSASEELQIKQAAAEEHEKALTEKETALRLGKALSVLFSSPFITILSLFSFLSTFKISFVLFVHSLFSPFVHF